VAGGLASQAVSSALFGKQKSPAMASNPDVMVRQPITTHKIVYGRAKVSGPITFLDTTHYI
jgi:hypothetical protein